MSLVARGSRECTRPQLYGVVPLCFVLKETPIARVLKEGHTVFACDLVDELPKEREHTVRVVNARKLTSFLELVEVFLLNMLMDFVIARFHSEKEFSLLKNICVLDSRGSNDDLTLTSETSSRSVTSNSSYSEFSALSFKKVSRLQIVDSFGRKLPNDL